MELLSCGCNLFKSFTIWNSQSPGMSYINWKVEKNALLLLKQRLSSNSSLTFPNLSFLFCRDSTTHFPRVLIHAQKRQEDISLLDKKGRNGSIWLLWPGWCQASTSKFHSSLIRKSLFFDPTDNEAFHLRATPASVSRSFLFCPGFHTELIYAHFTQSILSAVPGVCDRS